MMVLHVRLIWSLTLEKSLYFVELMGYSLINVLNITENISRASIGPRSKLRKDFLAETSRDEENIFYAIDPNRTGASMLQWHTHISCGTSMTMR